jgi:NAD(P)-dependent dehydrogenase (short-subunit alcohol dehydrogenase family)
MTNQFQNKNVVVTGGANGIGRELAKTFAAQGAAVFVLDCDATNGTALEREWATIHFIEIDLGNATAIEKLWDNWSVGQTFIHILINNVGLSRFKPLLQLTTDEWDTILNVNLRAAFVCSRQFAAQHTHGNYGRIINIASTRHLMSEPNGEAYAASKGGLVSLTHALAASLANTGITVNCISPGWIHTGNVSDLTQEDHQQHFSGRVGRPADIASMCTHLCQPPNDFINGQNIYIDGGMTKKMIYI